MLKEKSFPNIVVSFGMGFPLECEYAGTRARCRKGLPRIYPLKTSG